MSKFSPEERRGVVAVVAIALVLCLFCIGMNHFGPIENKDAVEVRMVVAADSIPTDTTVKTTTKKGRFGKRKNGAVKFSGKRRSGKKNVEEYKSRDLLSDTIPVKR